MRQKNTAIITNPAERLAQASLMLADRLAGAPIAKIQERFACSPSQGSPHVEAGPRTGAG